MGSQQRYQKVKRSCPITKEANNSWTALVFPFLAKRGLKKQVNGKENSQKKKTNAKAATGTEISAWALGQASHGAVSEPSPGPNARRSDWLQIAERSNLKPPNLEPPNLQLKLLCALHLRPAKF